MLVFEEAALKPLDRQREVEKEAAGSGVLNNEHLSALGIKVASQPMLAPARQLPAPTVAYQRTQLAVNPDKAVWQPRNVRFDHPAQCQRWRLLVFCDGNDLPDKYLRSVSN